MPPTDSIQAEVTPVTDQVKGPFKKRWLIPIVVLVLILVGVVAWGITHPKTNVVSQKPAPPKAGPAQTRTNTQTQNKLTVRELMDQVDGSGYKTSI